MESKQGPLQRSSKEEFTRDEMERILTAKQDWLKTVDALGTPMVVHDRDFRVIRANKAYAKRAGLDFGEILGRPYFTCFPKLPAPVAIDQPAPGPRSGEVVSSGPILTEDGGAFVAYAYSNDLATSAETVLVFEDITERKRVLDALERSDRFHQKLIDGASDAFFVLDRNGTITYRSESGQRLSGYEASELIGESLFRFIAPDAIEQVRAVLEDTLERPEREFRSEATAIKRDGSRILVEATGRNLLHDPDVRGVIVTVRDITERRRFEVALRENEEVLRSVTASAQDAVVMLDGDGCIVLWNAAAHRTFGYTEAEALGKELHPLLAPAHYLDAFRDGFRRFVADGAGPVVGKTVELDARRKDGSVFPMELSLSSVKVRGSWHAIGIARDISARKRHEAELMQANRALRTLSAGNAALVHALDEKALLHEMCEAVVTVGAYAAAAVVYAVDADPLRVAVQAAVGGGWAVEGQRAHGCVGMDVEAVASAAIATQSPQCRELSIQASDSAAMAGVAVSPASRSVLALPLVSEKAAAFGALCIVAMDGEVFHEAEFKLLGELAIDLAYGIETNRARGAQIAAEVELRESLQATVEAIGATVEARDPYTAGHQRRVAQLAAAIGQEMGLAPHTIEGIHFGAQIHDLGKIQIPGEILAKPARLSRIEFELIKQHPQVGYDILKGIKFPWPVADMVLQHHERLDGSGYPQGLKGEEIRLESRILAVADVVEAVGSHRPYRPALGVDAALDLIVAHRGTWFDGAVVDACVELFRTKAFAFQHS